jgi:hypothetical protein
VVRIALNTTGPPEVLNLEEVQLFDNQGGQLPASSLNFSMSSQWGEETSAAKWACPRSWPLRALMLVAPHVLSLARVLP